MDRVMFFMVLSGTGSFLTGVGRRQGSVFASY